MDIVSKLWIYLPDHLKKKIHLFPIKKKIFIQYIFLSYMQILYYLAYYI